MIGELIATGITYGVGRIALNDAFSGTAEFNNIILDSGADFSGGTGGGVIYSGGTDLYDIFITTNDGNDTTRVQPGTNITTGGTGNFPIVNLNDNIVLTSVNATTLTGGTIYSGSTELSSILNSLAGTSGDIWSASTGNNSFIANNGTGNVSSGVYSNILGGSGNTISSSNSFIAGGNSNSVAGGSESFIIGGTSNSSQRINNAIINSNNCYNLLATTAPGREHENNTVLNSVDSALLDSTGSTIISCSGITILNAQWVTGMQRAYIDEYIDFRPQSNFPPASIGRMFFSGTPLFRLMINTGGTVSDWILV